MLAYIKGIRWAIVFRAIIWTAIWCGVFGLVVKMSERLADKEPVIFGVIIVAAIVGSVSITHALLNWRHGAWGSSLAALLVGVFAITVHAALDTSYWSGIIDQINEQVIRERAVTEARDIVAEKRKQRYANYSVSKTAAQIEMDLKAAELNDRWRLSAGCTAVTSKPSQDFCRSYFELKSQHAAAKEASALETMWDAGTSVETQVRRNLAAAATLAARVLGGKAEEWTGIIVAALVVLIQLVLAFAFVIGYAPDKRSQKTLTDHIRHASADNGSHTTPAVTVRPVELQPIHPGLRVPLKTFVGALGAKVSLSEIPNNSPVWKMSGPAELFTGADKNSGSHLSPDPDPKGGTPVAAPDHFRGVTKMIPEPPTGGGMPIKSTEVANSEQAAEVANIEPASTVVTGPWQTEEKPVASRRELKLLQREQADKPHMEVIKRFLAENYDGDRILLKKSGGRKSGGTPASEVIADYERWCEETGAECAGGSHFGRFAKQIMEGTRTAAGRFYPIKRRQAITRKRAA